MSRQKVKLADNIARVVFIETDATIGATFGTDFRLPNGQVATVDSFRALLGVTSADDAEPFHHRLLQGLPLGDDHPQYTRKDTLTTRGDIYVRGVSTVVRKALGLDRQFLRSDGLDPVYETVSPTITLGSDLSGSVTLTNLTSGTLNAEIVANAVGNIELRDSAGLSVIGRSANSVGDPADIVGAADQVLRVNSAGTILGFGTVATAGLTDASVTNAKLADMAQSRIIGRAEGAGTGAPTYLTPTEVVSIIDGEAATWTALHTFTANILLSSANPRIRVLETGLAADTGGYDINWDAGTMQLRTRTDADGTGVPVVTVTRPSGTQPLRLFTGALDADLAGFSTVAGNVNNFTVVFSAFDLTRNANFCLVSTQRPLFNMLKYAGTFATPTQIQNNTALHSFGFACYNTDTAAIATSADITCTSTETWSSTAQGTRMDLRTTPNGSTTRTINIRLAESQIQLLDGTAAAPSNSFQNDTNTGTYRIGADNLGISTGGTLRWDIDTTDIVTTLPQRGPDGSAAAPTYSFSGVTTKGMYSVGTNQIGFSANSVLQFEVGDSYTDLKTQARFTAEYRPAQYTANQNDIALPATASVFYFSTDASRNLTGMQGGVAGRMVIGINNGTQPAVIVNDATSTAANRFLNASGTNSTFQGGGCGIFLYDGTASRWRLITRLA